MTHQEKLESIGGEINEAVKNLIDEAKLQWEKNGNLIVGVFVATLFVYGICKALPIIVEKYLYLISAGISANTGKVLLLTFIFLNICQHKPL